MQEDEETLCLVELRCHRGRWLARGTDAETQADPEAGCLQDASNKRALWAAGSHRNLFPHSSGGQKSKIEVLAGPRSL